MFPLQNLARTCIELRGWMLIDSVSHIQNKIAADKKTCKTISINEFIYHQWGHGSMVEACMITANQNQASVGNITKPVGCGMVEWAEHEKLHQRFWMLLTHCGLVMPCGDTDLGQH